MKPVDPIDSWDANEIANLLGVSKRTVDRWASKGQIPKPAGSFKGRNLWRNEDVKKIKEWYMKRVPRSKAK